MPEIVIKSINKKGSYLTGYDWLSFYELIPGFEEAMEMQNSYTYVVSYNKIVSNYDFYTLDHIMMNDFISKVNIETPSGTRMLETLNVIWFNEKTGKHQEFKRFAFTDRVVKESPSLDL